MAANFSPFKSDTGFSSPGFLVSPTGSLSLSGDLLVSELVINGISILETEDSTVSLSSSIKNSSLTGLGQLERLKVKGDIFIEDIDDNINIEIVDGKITIVSTIVGNIDNVDIGQTSAGQGSFTILTAIDADINVSSITQLNSNVAIIDDLTSTDLNTDSAIIGDASINQATINELSSDNVTVNEQPTSLSHATRKDYVDNRITALSIALGA
jgi:hypothetical protein